MMSLFVIIVSAAVAAATNRISSGNASLVDIKVSPDSISPTGCMDTTLSEDGTFPADIASSIDTTSPENNTASACVIFPAITDPFAESHLL